MKKYLIIGNAESVHIVKWTKELVKYFDVYIISSKGLHNDIRNLVPPDKTHSLNLKISDSGGNYRILFKIFRVKKIINKIDPDFINAHYITSHGFLAALVKIWKGKRFKLIQSTWGSDVLVTPFKNKFYKAITRFSLNQADLITSDSEFMTGVIKKFTTNKTMTFIFGLDFLPTIDASIKDENFYYSNRMLTENYNIRGVIDLFKRIHQMNSLAKLTISNEGDQKKELEDHVADLGLQNVITFVGFISQAEQSLYYGQAQFYISLPFSDSTSVSLIEAMAYGCIPVVSDLPANREWVTDLQNGIICSDEKDIETKISTMLLKKEEIMNKNRQLINEKGIFPDLMSKFVSSLNDL